MSCAVLVVLLACSTRGSGPFEPTWESLDRYECPDWFRDAKFGIYAHWGPYSATDAPELTDWYSHHMFREGHPIYAFHRATHGSPKRFPYHRFIERFRAERFDADAWADLYVEAGARFAGPVAEHADGFAMWPSAVTPWNAAEMGPQRDVVGEMESAIRSRGIRFMASLHHQWKWAWYPTWSDEIDTTTERMRTFYGPPAPEGAFEATKTRIDYADLPTEMLPPAEFADEWLAKCREVIDRYHPDLLWFDNRMNILPEHHRREMAAHFYNDAAREGCEPVLTYKDTEMRRGSAVLDLERTRMTETYPDPWLCDMSIASNSWSYATTLEYYSTDRLIHDLVDIVSKNGCLLLNIAPAPDGTIPEPQQQRLRAIGGWLRVNGDAIYGSRPWSVFGEGPAEIPQGHLADLKFDGFSPKDIRFTVGADGTLYTIVLGWPGVGTEVTIRTLAQGGPLRTRVEAIECVASGQALDWRRTEEALIITMPADLPETEAVAFRIVTAGVICSADTAAE